MTQTIRRASGLFAFCAAAVLLCPAPTLHAAPKPKPGTARAERSKPALDLEQLKRELASADEARMLAALESIASLEEPDGGALAPLVDDVLRRGAPVKTSARALQVAGQLRQPASSRTIAPYLRHRDPELRRAAVNALPQTGGPDAVAALRLGLRSPDPAVRAAAASGLGSLRATDALPDLLAALERMVLEAAPAIGRLCAPSQCEAFSGRLGRLPLSVMTAGLDEILFRDAGEVPDATKLRIIEQLRALGSAEARGFLNQVLSRWPEAGSAAVRAALEAAVQPGRRTP